jgi:uncharacterized protein (DUF433 family)
MALDGVIYCQERERTARKGQDMASRILAPGIVSDTEILGGKPVLEGARIPTYVVLGKLGAGMTLAEIQEEYDLTEDQVRAALAYAPSPRR